MIFVPPPPVLAACVVVPGLPLLLVLLSHGPWRVVAPGRRFVVAAALGCGAWGTTLALMADLEPADVIAGLLILLSAVLAEFTLWTLLAWGFTASLLMSLAKAERAVTLEEWVAEYTQGRAIDALAQDRLAVLLRFGLAAQIGDRIVVKLPLGSQTARAAWTLRWVFGLSTC